jgi:hypothetical protein
VGPHVHAAFHEARTSRQVLLTQTLHECRIAYVDPRRIAFQPQIVILGADDVVGAVRIDKQWGRVDISLAGETALNVAVRRCRNSRPADGDADMIPDDGVGQCCGTKNVAFDRAKAQEALVGVECATIDFWIG